MSTGAFLVSSLVALLGSWLVLEVVKLRNSTPNDHITAVVRWAVKEQPGPFIWFFFTLGFLMGHLLWP